MYQVCIFDLDGTLCDSVESIACCANKVMRELGRKEAAAEEYYYFVGEGVDMLIRRLLQFGGDEECALFDEAKKRYMKYFETDCLYHVVPYEGIVETLKGLKEKGARLAVLSNKPHENTKKVIESVFGAGLFDWVQGQTPEIPRKPDPAGAFAVAEKLGVQPEDCLYVGDTGTDMKTGSSAGMYTVGVLWGFREEPELWENGADCVITKPQQLLEIYR